MRRKVAIAIGLAAIAVLSLWLYADSFQKEVQGGKKIAVPVASQEIQAGTKLTKAMITAHEVPESYIHPSTVLQENLNQIIGMPVSEKLEQGQPFLWSNFDVGKSAAGSRRLATAIAKGQRALTLPVDLSGSMAGMLRPGDHVDILGTFARQQNSDFATVTLLQNVLVVATGDLRGESADVESSGQGGTRTFPSITVSVDLEEAELLVFAMQRGPINIVLRGAEDIATEEQVPDKNFGDIFEAPKRANFAHRHAQRIQALKAQ